MRNGKYHMEIRNLQQFLPAGFNPLLPFVPLASGAMPIPAAIVAQVQPAAAVAFIYMPSQFGSPALADGVQCPAFP
jgi:hypothetical protein